MRLFMLALLCMQVLSSERARDISLRDECICDLLWHANIMHARLRGT